MAARSRCRSTGLVRKSTAPAFIARTLAGMSPWPVRKTTGTRARVADESLLQLETIDARHVEIEHETGGHIVVFRFTLQKLAGRCVGMDVEVRSAQQARQRGSHGLVVVHDVHDPAVGRRLLHRLTSRES